MQLLFAVSMLVCLLGFTGAVAPDDCPLQTVSGTVDKADEASVTLKTGKKSLTLKVTGTSKVTVLAPQKRGDKVVLTQRE